MYKIVLQAKRESQRKFEISYFLLEEENSYYIESFIEGSFSSEISYLGNCKGEKAEEILHLLAEKAVRPVHLDDVISDIMS